MDKVIQFIRHNEAHINNNPTGHHSNKAFLSLSDEVFEDGRFPCRLAADDSNLRQVERVVLAEVSKRVLQLVDNRNQPLHPLVRRHLGGKVLHVV